MKRTVSHSYGMSTGSTSGFYEPAIPTADQEHDGWLISFADILTLLVTLFVLLLAFSHYTGQVKPSSRVQPKHELTATDPPVPVVKPPAPIRDTNDLTIPDDLQHKLEITRTATSVNFEIKDSVLFDTGSADLKPAGRALIERIAAVLARSRYPIAVEGHTDNAPISTARFPSNWELSTSRATTVTRFLIESGIATDRLRATGFADTKPLAGNDSDSDRARNRRVSLVVQLNDQVTRF